MHVVVDTRCRKLVRSSRDLLTFHLHSFPWDGSCPKPISASHTVNHAVVDLIRLPCATLSPCTTSGFLVMQGLYLQYLSALGSCWQRAARFTDAHIIMQQPQVIDTFGR